MIKHQDRGSASVEFALVIPVVVLALVGSFELLAVVRTQMTLMASAREGVRVAATSPDPSRAARAAREALPEDLAASARISVSRPHVAGRPASVEVSATYRVTPEVFGGVPVTLRGRAVMLVEP